MSLEVLIWVVMVIMLVIGAPVFMSLGMASVAVIVLSYIPLSLVMIDLIKVSDMFPLLAVVGFVLAGALMDKGGMAARIVEVASMLVGRIRGGLGIVTILGCMFFASMIGSGPGTVAAMGSLMIPSMVRRGIPPNMQLAFPQPAVRLAFLSRQATPCWYTELLPTFPFPHCSGPAACGTTGLLQFTKKFRNPKRSKTCPDYRRRPHVLREIISVSS